jgi:hypothetical protein
VVSGVPFKVVQSAGVTWIDTNVDQAFRKALMDGVPVPLRGKMQRALAAVPDRARDHAHSERYFGDELPAIAERVKPLAIELDRYLASARDLPGFMEWLILTGYEAHYEMVKVFNEWALMKVSAEPV